MELKILRIRARLSQAEAAEAIGVNQAALSRWEIGKTKPTEENVKKLAEVYGVCPDVVRKAVDTGIDDLKYDYIEKLAALCKVSKSEILQFLESAVRKQNHQPAGKENS